jgi:hypothetical protein
MKLVTGIEAVQSGKPWKHKSYDGWMTDSLFLNRLTSEDLRKKEFIIKEEPREFWIDTTYPNCVQLYPINYAGADFSGDNWIRVREVEK